MHQNRILILLCVGVLLLSILACGSATTDYPGSDNRCSSPLSGGDADTALSRISFEVPSNWSEIKHNQKYLAQGSLLTVFVFQTSAPPKTCVETMIQVVSGQSVVESYRMDATNFYIDGKSAAMAVADGYFDSSKTAPFRGIYAGVGSGTWVYVFAWDSSGIEAVRTVADDATFTIGTINIP